MNIKNLHIVLLAFIVLYLIKDTFHLFSASTAIGVISVVGFIVLTFFMVKFKLPEIKKAKEEAQAKKKAAKEIRDLVANKVDNKEIE